MTAAKPRFATFVRYAKVELIPPMPNEFGEVARGFGGLLRGIRTRSYRDMTVKEAWINTLVGVEVLCWFWVGECIGKGSLVGYNV
jgi:F-type H+-transporting ATPase subunit g